ncbi:MAG: carboxylating nicotinate-nucleotide diphosphorylase [Hyphomicrobium sp.]|nr:carboxylating nicotinate-nucleotide diphosphorylase [Hyphomicrobium sp.]
MAVTLPRLPRQAVQKAVSDALAEDLGLSGDITTDATVAPNATADAVIASRQDGVISGLDLAAAAFAALDDGVRFDVVSPDGTRVEKGYVVARISGSARAILTAERVALNYLGRLSGIATLTRRYVDAVSGTGAAIVDTRKTTPGLRAFEKYAVRCGGGRNHRTGLFDAILIKDNHIVAAGGIDAAIERARAHAGHMVKVEVEVDTLEQLARVMQHRVDAVLLDNMTPATLREAVKMVAGRALTEASGGVNLSTARAIADAGVDLISVGALTHSAPVLDLGLDFA